MVLSGANSFLGHKLDFAPPFQNIKPTLMWKKIAKYFTAVFFLKCWFFTDNCAKKHNPLPSEGYCSLIP